MLLRKSLKILSISWLILFAFRAHATNYYLSNSGNDANSGTEPSTPWQTLNKLNSFKNLKPGDSVLFKRGDIFYGSITISNSGSAENPITFGVYGAGENPIVTGFKVISTWSRLRGNIYYSSLDIPTLNIVTLNGAVQRMGRYPNSGYLNYESHTNNTSITDKQLKDSIDWTGAEVVIRKHRWILDRHIITNQTGSTLSYNALSTYGNNNAYQPLDGNGYFIQGHLATLDNLGEWYYDSTASRFYMHFGAGTPLGKVIKVSTQDKNLVINSQNYINLNNLNFEGGNTNGIYLVGANNITFNNCNFTQQGGNAVYGIDVSYITVNGGNISDALNNGIWIENNGSYCIVDRVSMSNIGTVAGAGRSGDGAQEGIFINGVNSIIRNCTITNTGYNAIGFDGNSAIVENNFIDTFCTIKDDGAGIYTYIGKNAIIRNNIVLNAIGAYAGSESAYWEPFGKAAGIYLDNGINSHKATVTGNTVAHGHWGGIFINDNSDNEITNNLVYDFAQQLLLIESGIGHVRNTNITGNKFIAKTSSQKAFYNMMYVNESPSLFGNIDNNFYARPISDSLSIQTTTDGYTPTYRTLEGWKSYSNQDVHSSKSPKTVTDTSDLKFEYNETFSSKTISLPYSYIDVTGLTYNATLELAPFSSTVLIKNGAIINELPKANAGSNQSIELPTNFITLSGSGTDVKGTIIEYLWTKISGPSNYNNVNATSSITEVTGLTEGIYQFELKVTDNQGSVGRDTVLVTVNPPTNIPPIANAGPDKKITLPVNSISVQGAASDSDGTITSYAWSKLAGPSDYTISNSSSSEVDFTGLVAGIYQFELKVTDNNGAVARDTVQVTVDAALNILPAANAGTNKTITLPVNTITLSGSGSDQDGTITGYLWTKKSGSSNYIIINPVSPLTEITGLTEGVYEFQLIVTDNEGATAASTVQVTVNPAPKIPPIADAGVNKAITLPVNSVSLTGSITETDAPISSILWTKISGPSAYNIDNSSSAVTTISGLFQGTYQFELLVKDINGLQAKDTVSILVNPAPNIPPTANAGANQTITLPTNTVTLSGSGKDSDGSVAVFIWTQIFGANTTTITNPTSPSTSVKGLIQGNYVFKLTITDNLGATGSDTISVTVNAPPNIALAAHAGFDQIITLPTNSVSLFGSGTDPDGTIASYSWTKISGPLTYNISNASSAITPVSALLEGVYLFELNVTDDKGAIGSDTVQVTVNAVPNIAPTANAGADQTITLPINIINLIGSGTDDDGTIVSYLWTKIAGPAGGTIVDSLAASTTAKGLIPGNYVFQLTITDNGGAKGTDTLNVTVNTAKNIAPTANAEGDLTILLPLNTVYLNGSGNDEDGTITAYQWKQIAGPDSALIITENKVSTVVKNLVAGTYEFELAVTDDNGETGRDIITVVVALGRSSSKPNSVKVYPNPVRGIATMEITSENVNSQITLIVSNFSGKAVYKKQFSVSDYKATEKINMSLFSKGSYTVSVFFDERDRHVLKIIKQ